MKKFQSSFQDSNIELVETSQDNYQEIVDLFQSIINTN